MKLLIFGAGAIGGVIGAILSKVHDVTLVTRGDHLAEIKRNGLRIKGLLTEEIRIPAFDSIKDDESFDAILVTTKSYDTETAAKSTLGHLVEGGCLITVQNGIGNAEKLAEIHGPEKIVIGITSMAAHRLEPGIVKFVAGDEITLGSLIRKSRALDIANRIFESSKIKTRMSENIQGVIWSKAIINAAINPITAINRCNNGRIVSDKELNEQAIAVCLEGMRIAASKKIVLEPSDVIKYMTRVAMNTADNRSSMLSDIENGKRTEIESICGSILRAGKELKIEAPTIEKIYSEVKSLEKKSLKPRNRK